MKSSPIVLLHTNQPDQSLAIVKRQHHVFKEEPLPAGHDLWGMQNVILTAHCSSVCEGWELESVTMFSENLERYRCGSGLNNIVDPVRGY